MYINLIRESLKQFSAQLHLKNYIKVLKLAPKTSTETTGLFFFFFQPLHSEARSL